MFLTLLQCCIVIVMQIKFIIVDLKSPDTDCHMVTLGKIANHRWVTYNALGSEGFIIGIPCKFDDYVTLHILNFKNTEVYSMLGKWETKIDKVSKVERKIYHKLCFLLFLDGLVCGQFLHEMKQELFFQQYHCIFFCTMIKTPWNPKPLSHPWNYLDIQTEWNAIWLFNNIFEFSFSLW